MKPVPSNPSEASASLQKAAATRDPTEWQRAIQLGYQMIDMMYQPHWLRRPFDVFRRRRARQWWEQEVRLTRQQMWTTLLQMERRGLEKQMTRPVYEEEERYQENRAAEWGKRWREEAWEQEKEEHEQNIVRLDRQAELQSHEAKVMRPIQEDEEAYRKQRAWEEEQEEHRREIERIQMEAERRRLRIEVMQPLDEAEQARADERQRKLREFETEQQIKLARAAAEAQARATVLPPDPTDLTAMIKAINQVVGLTDEERRDLLNFYVRERTANEGTR